MFLLVLVIRVRTLLMVYYLLLVIIIGYCSELDIYF